MTLWLVNPAKKARRKSKRRARKLSGAALAAHARRAAKRATSTGGRMAKSRKRRRANPKRRHRGLFVARKANPGKRRRKARGLFRRNPGGAVGSLMGLGKQGLKDAAGVVVGKAATRIVSGLIPVGVNTGIVGALKQMLSAVAVGYGAQRFMGREFSRMVVAGGIAAPLETLLKSFTKADGTPMIPILTTALSAGDEAYAAMGAYPLAAYPAALPAGDGYGSGTGMAGQNDFDWHEM